MNIQPPHANTQNGRILECLQFGYTITPIDALKKFGCFRLGARIYDLKKMGFPIKKKMVNGGSGKKFAQYSL